MWVGSVQNSAVGGDGDDAPGDEFAAGLQGSFHSVFNAAATGDFHTDHGDTFDIVVFQYGGEFFGIVALVQFGTADEGNVIADKFIVEIAVGIGGAVCRNQQIGTVKVGGVDRDQFDLYRPLQKLACDRCGDSAGGAFDGFGGGAGATAVFWVRSPWGKCSAKRMWRPKAVHCSMMWLPWRTVPFYFLM